MPGLYDSLPDPPTAGPYGRAAEAPRRGGPHRHRDTSIVARESIRDASNLFRQAVLIAVRNAGTRGLTDEEGIELTGMNPSTWRPRRGECVTDELIADSGRRRPARSNRPAIIWVATEKGRAAERGGATEGDR
jgi:hypothetical protein